CCATACSWARAGPATELLRPIGSIRWVAVPDRTEQTHSSVRVGPAIRAQTCSPGAGLVVLHEAAVEVLAGFSHHDRVIDPGGAVDQVQRRVPALGGDPQLLLVWP